MTLLVDSSVFIDWLNDVPTLQTERLRAWAYRRPVVIADLVLTEILQGARDDAHASKLAHMLAAFAFRPVLNHACAVEAARNYRHLRSLGITVRKTIDTLIATRCILDDLPLLYSDRDFEPFVAHLGLRDAMAEPV